MRQISNPRTLIKNERENVEKSTFSLFLHMYLHAEVLHMVFNIFALLFAEKIVEKKIGSFLYLLIYNAIVKDI